MVTFKFMARWGKQGSTIALKGLQVAAGILFGICAWFIFPALAAYFIRVLIQGYRYLFLPESYQWTMAGWSSWTMIWGVESHAAKWAFENANYVFAAMMSVIGYKVTGILKPFVGTEKEVKVMCLCPDGKEVEGIPVEQAQAELAKRKKVSQGSEESISDDSEKPADPHSTVLALPATEADSSIKADKETPHEAALIKRKKGRSARKAASEPIPEVMVSEDEISQLADFIGTPAKEASLPALAAPSAPLLQLSINSDPAQTRQVSCQIIETTEGMEVSCKTKANQKAKEAKSVLTAEQGSPAPAKDQQKTDVEAQAVLVAQVTEKRKGCIIC